MNCRETRRSRILILLPVALLTGALALGCSGGGGAAGTQSGATSAAATTPSAGPAEVDSDLWTGTSGATYFGQSFNETRAVTVTVLSPTDRVVESLTLEGLHAPEFALDESGVLRAVSVLVGARVYDNVTGALIASDNVTVAPAADVSVTVPLSATLMSGRSYRVGFYVKTTPLGKASADMLWPSSFVDLYNQNSYVESSGIFRVNSAHATSSDSFPANPNMFVPRIIIRSGTL